MVQTVAKVTAAGQRAEDELKMVCLAHTLHHPFKNAQLHIRTVPVNSSKPASDCCPGFR